MSVASWSFPDPAARSEGNHEMVRRSSGDQAALYIRRLIFDGELRPGDRVPQDEVAKALGISRIPVREALIALEREGWVTNELHRGTFISSMDETAVRDHYALFGLIYGFAARMAILRGSEALVEALSEIHAQLMAADTPEEIGRLTLRFHGAIVDAAASPPTKVLLRAMSALVPGPFFAYVPKAIDPERRGLTATLRAIKQGHPEQAEVAYVTMMQRVGEQVVRLFRDRGLFDRKVDEKS